jgi:hypothetical protein
MCSFRYSQGNPVVHGVICRRSEALIEGEQPAISEPVIGQVPQSAKLFGAAVRRGKEGRGSRRKAKCQSSNAKRENPNRRSRVPNHEHETHGHGHETWSEGTGVFTYENHIPM